MTEPRKDLPPMPRRIARLPIDERGYPIPWFVAEVDGKRDFRVADSAKRIRAVKDHICWICGDYLGAWNTFAIGPMCAVNRVTAEPPCHTDCAIFAAIACPFLSKPMAKRREANLPESVGDPGGLMIERNPGVTCLWTTAKLSPFRTPDGGWLIRLGPPITVEWYCRGRIATKTEVIESVESGLPKLLELAEKDGPDAIEELRRAVGEAEKLYPKEPRLEVAP